MRHLSNILAIVRSRDFYRANTESGKCAMSEVVPKTPGQD